MDTSRSRLSLLVLGASVLLAPAAIAACGSGNQLLPNLRVLPARDITVVLDSQGNPTDAMKFSTTSWNAGHGKLELVTKDTGSVSQRVDQRIYCKDGTFEERNAGFFEYHAAHNHVHFNDYANYMLEPLDSNLQNVRKGTKTTFCLMDNTNINTQLLRAPASEGFTVCAGQVVGSVQGLSVGWGDTYANTRPGQSLDTTNLPRGTYRLRMVVDPKNLIAETNETDNEACKLVEIGVGFVADRGPCTTPPTPRIHVVSPNATKQGTCATVTISGENLAPEMRLSFLYGTGPAPSPRNLEFPGSAMALATVCVAKAQGKNRLGNDPVWDLGVGNPTLSHVRSATLPNAFRVTR